LVWIATLQRSFSSMVTQRLSVAAVIDGMN